MKYNTRSLWLVCLLAAAVFGVTGLRLLAQPDTAASDSGAKVSDHGDVRAGREIWFNATFGDEQYYALLAQLSNPTKRILIGFTNVLLTPRASRFDQWGMINDPDCRANPAGGFDNMRGPARDWRGGNA